MVKLRLKAQSCLHAINYFTFKVKMNIKCPFLGLFWRLNKVTQKVPFSTYITQWNIIQH